MKVEEFGSLKEDNLRSKDKIVGKYFHRSILQYPQ